MTAAKRIELSKKLKKFLHSKQLTYAQFALRSGLTASQICKYVKMDVLPTGKRYERVEFTIDNWESLDPSEVSPPPTLHSRVDDLEAAVSALEQRLHVFNSEFTTQRL